jgi:hypothetical protein
MMTPGVGVLTDSIVKQPKTVIASKAKQSISPRKERMDCFASLAMTARYRFAISRLDMPEVCQKFPQPSENRGRRESRALDAPAASRAK